MKALFVPLAVLLVATAALADCGTPVIRVVRKPVVVESFITPILAPVAVFAPFAVSVPTYSAAFTPQQPLPQGQPQQLLPQGQPQQQPQQAPPDQVLKLLQQLAERMDRLEKGPGGPAPAAGKAPGLELTPAPSAVLSAKCARCHQEGSQSKGGGFVLLARDGSPVRLDDGAKWKVMRNTYKNVMPPSKSGVAALTDEEVGQLFEYLDGMK